MSPLIHVLAAQQLISRSAGEILATFKAKMDKSTLVASSAYLQI